MDDDCGQLTLDSPIGPLRLTAAGGRLTGLFMQAHEGGVRAAPAALRGGGLDWELVEAELSAYFGGDGRTFTTPIELRGTAFQRGVWAELQRIPYGQTISYGELAARIGNPRAVRAVGLANGRNPVSIIVPCHRVIGADGSLTGYGGGLERKSFLLDLERTSARLF